MSGQVINRGAYSSFKTVRFNNDQIKQWPVTNVLADSAYWGESAGFNVLIQGESNKILFPREMVIVSNFSRGAYSTAGNLQAIGLAGFANGGSIQLLGMWLNGGGTNTAVITNSWVTSATQKVNILNSYSFIANTHTGFAIETLANQPIYFSVRNNSAGTPQPLTGGHKDNYCEITVYFDAVFVNNQ